MSGAAAGDGLVRLARLEARLAPGAARWPWAEANAEEVGAYWRRARALKPKMFDGEVLILDSLAIEGGACRATCIPVRFSAFLTWLKSGCPDRTVMNGFGMAALRASDGAFLLGEMAPHTANAGQVYFPAGTPDRSDLGPDGTLDLEGSVLRELAEETGLASHEVALSPGWTLSRDGGIAAFLREARLAMTGEEARAAILARLARQAEPELSDIVLVRGPEDIDAARMPRYLTRYLTHHLTHHLRAAF